MDTFTTIIYLLSWAVTVFAATRIIRVFFEKRRTSILVLMLSYLLFYVSPVLAFLLFNIPIISIIANLVPMFIITLNYESTIVKRFATMLGTYLLLVAAEFHAAFLADNNHLTLFDHVGYSNIVGFIGMALTSVIIMLFIQRFKNISKNTITSPIFWISAVVIPALSIIVFVLGVMYLPQGPVIITTAAISIINILVFYFQDILSTAYEDKLKSALHIQEKEYYFAQNQLMQESVKKVRSIRHDMNFHLAAIKDFTGENKAATDYINSLLNDISKSEVYSTTGNIAFDSIINFKLKTAEEDSVKLDLSIFVPPVVNVEIADIVTILGNLLDNALDAVAKVEDKLIKLDIEYSKESLFIQLENTFDGEVKYEKGKSEADKIITTRKDGDNHGYGLKNIRKSVEKYNGHVDISHDGNVFSVGVLLYVNEE